jgi:hypothetical protein
MMEARMVKLIEEGARWGRGRGLAEDAEAEGMMSSTVRAICPYIHAQNKSLRGPATSRRSAARPVPPLTSELAAQSEARPQRARTPNRKTLCESRGARRRDLHAE